MRSSRPKPLHLMCGRPMVMHVIHALADLQVDRTVVVVGHGAERVTKKVQEQAPNWAHVTFVEQDRRAAALVSENLARCGVQSGYAIIRATVARTAEALRNGPGFVPFDLILLDPPYDQLAPEMACDVLAEVEGLLAPGGLVVLEHARRRPGPETAGRLVRGRLLASGDSSLSFYECQH